MPNPRKIVLDTNCLIASLSRHSEYYSVWKDFQAGKYTLCVSTSILQEYEEMIGRKTSVLVAKNVIALLLKSKNVELVQPYFNFHQFFRICNSEAVNISICNAELNDLRLPWYDSPTA